jgi:hypothetical protein
MRVHFIPYRKDKLRRVRKKSGRLVTYVKQYMLRQDHGPKTYSQPCMAQLDNADTLPQCAGPTSILDSHAQQGTTTTHISQCCACCLCKPLLSLLITPSPNVVVKWLTRQLRIRGGSRVQISARIPTIQTHAVRGFRQSLQANAGSALKLGHDRFLPHPNL